MKKVILFLVVILTVILTGCDCKCPGERTGDVIVEGKNTHAHGNAFQTITDYDIYGTLGDDHIKFEVTKEEYEGISVGDTFEIYNKYVYYQKRK